MSSAGLAQFRLDDRLAIVTGGANGIGRATATLLAGAGATLVIVDRDEAASAALAAELQDAGSAAVAMCADIARSDEIARVHGPIDVLVNNAGLALRKPAIDLPLADWDAVVAVNMTGVFLCARAAARQMIATGRGGAIVNVSSVMGLSGGGLYPNISYQTTKGAVVNMTRALAVEWAPNGIRVNAVAPTYVRTNFIAPLLAQPELVERIEAMTPLRRLAEPGEVAAAILFLASPAAAMITGHTLPVDGGFLAQ